MSKLEKSVEIFSPQETWSLSLFNKFVERIDASLKDRSSALGWLVIKSGVHEGYPGLSVSKVAQENTPELPSTAAEHINDYYNWVVLEGDERVLYGSDDDLDSPGLARALTLNLSLVGINSETIPRTFVAKAVNSA